MHYDPRRPEIPSPRRPAPAAAPRQLTALWIALAAVVFALSLAAGAASFVALRDDDPDDTRDSAANREPSGRSAPELTATLGDRLRVPGVADVRVLKVQRTKRLPHRSAGGAPMEARGVWIVVTLEITNRTRSDQTVLGSVLEIEDDRDIYTGPGGAGASQELFLRDALHQRRLRPGETATGRLAYDVQPDFKPLRLRVPHSWRLLDVDDPKVPVSYVELTRR